MPLTAEQQADLREEVGFLWINGHLKATGGQVWARVFSVPAIGPDKWFWEIITRPIFLGTAASEAEAKDNAVVAVRVRLTEMLRALDRV